MARAAERPDELLRALHFAAQKHRDQRRKGRGASPYINHPIEVAHVLAELGGVSDLDTLRAAVLHDTVEDTETSFAELAREFGEGVCALVAEVSDDKTLPKQERKRLQVVHASGLSLEAKCIKLADKICNVRDLTHTPPDDWSLERRGEYFDWTESVVAGCRGASEALERVYDEVLQAGREALAAETEGV